MKPFSDLSSRCSRFRLLVVDKENIAARSETGSVKPLSGGQSLHPDKAAMLAKASDILPVLTPSPEPPSPATRTTKAKPGEIHKT